MATSFLIYDIAFLAVFAIGLFIFLRSGRKNLKREGSFILYRTPWGIKLMDKIGKKHPNLFTVLSYISIAISYILTALAIYLVLNVAYIYATIPSVVRAIKIPPLLPLFPYVPQIFKLSFLPPFYFTYWIVIIAIVAITHEFAHGIFMRRYNIKIKSTGFLFFPWFLPVFLGAFVEQDEKSMKKSKNFEQLAAVSAGVFANVLTAILFFAVIWIFFSLTFAPAGVMFDSYASNYVDVNSISSINGISLQNNSYDYMLSLANETGLNKIKAGGEDYVTTKDILNQSKGSNVLVLYHDAPAINAQLESVIMEINGVKLYKIQQLSNELSAYSPGEKVTLRVLGKDGEGYNRDIMLGKKPGENSSWLGILISRQQSQTWLGEIFSRLSFKDSHVYYDSKWNGFGIFIYQLLWWIVLASVSVAIVNMLPAGFLDGGMFFYLTMLSITRNEKVAKLLSKISTWIVAGILLLLMLLWIFALI